MAALGGCLSEPELMGGIMAMQKHNLATLFTGDGFEVTRFCVVKKILFHNRLHYSKF
jgi:hypothetical protein